MRLCECGCGQPTSIIKKSCASRGLVAGEFMRFRTGHSGRKAIPEIVYDDALKCLKIPLNYGLFALVDVDDRQKVESIRWYQIVDGGCTYAAARILASKKIVSLHRWILGAEPGALVDHRNHDGLDNRRRNLRLCDHSENGMNRRVMTRHGNPKKSKFIGVVYAPRGNLKNPWRVHIQARGVMHRIGRFPTEEEAALARDEASKRIHGEFACLNFKEHQ